jgi:hypothetical protein
MSLKCYKPYISNLANRIEGICRNSLKNKIIIIVSNRKSQLFLTPIANCSDYLQIKESVMKK